MELNVKKIEENLKTAAIGRQIHYYEQVTSTMDVAREMAEGGAMEGSEWPSKSQRCIRISRSPPIIIDGAQASTI